MSQIIPVSVDPSVIEQYQGFRNRIGSEKRGSASQILMSQKMTALGNVLRDAVIEAAQAPVGNTTFVAIETDTVLQLIGEIESGNENDLETLRELESAILSTAIAAVRKRFEEDE